MVCCYSIRKCSVDTVSAGLDASIDCYRVILQCSNQQVSSVSSVGSQLMRYVGFVEWYQADRIQPWVQ